MNIKGEIIKHNCLTYYDLELGECFTFFKDDHLYMRMDTGYIDLFTGISYDEKASLCYIPIRKIEVTLTIEEVDKNGSLGT